MKLFIILLFVLTAIALPVAVSVMHIRLPPEVWKMNAPHPDVPFLVALSDAFMVFARIALGLAVIGVVFFKELSLRYFGWSLLLLWIGIGVAVGWYSIFPPTAPLTLN